MGSRELETISVPEFGVCCWRRGRKRKEARKEARLFGKELSLQVDIACNGSGGRGDCLGEIWRQ